MIKINRKKLVGVPASVLKIVTRRSDRSVWCTKGSQAKEIKINLYHDVRYFCGAK